MDSIKVHDKNFVPYLTAAQIADKVKELAAHQRGLRWKETFIPCCIERVLPVCRRYFPEPEHRSGNFFYQAGLV